MNQKQKDQNEKISYLTKCNKWKEIKMSGDIQAICEISDRSTSIVSKAVNSGKGSLYILRIVAKYFSDREDRLPGAVQYFTGSKKPYI